MRTTTNNKLTPNWEGPFRVIENVEKGAYRLEQLDGKRIRRTWNAANLRLYYIGPWYRPLEDSKTYKRQANQGLSMIRDQGNFRLSVPVAVAPESMGTRLGNQRSEVGLSLGRPLDRIPLVLCDSWPRVLRSEASYSHRGSIEGAPDHAIWHLPNHLIQFVITSNPYVDPCGNLRPVVARPPEIRNASRRPDNKVRSNEGRLVQTSRVSSLILGAIARPTHQLRPGAIPSSHMPGGGVKLIYYGQSLRDCVY
ncbi:hypothetical protein CR513_25658, partial [Mucuna pruriens]